jgi:hypothetical protein
LSTLDETIIPKGPCALEFCAVLPRFAGSERPVWDAVTAISIQWGDFEILDVIDRPVKWNR